MENIKINFSIKEEYLEKKIELELNKIGWISINQDEIRRIDYTYVLNERLLIDSLLKINKNIDLSIANKVLSKLKNITSNSLIEMNKQFWNLLLNSVKVYDDIYKKWININLIDFKNIDKNSFQLIRQLEVSDGKNLKRLDMVLFINGLPIIVIEIKSEVAREGLKDAYEQIKHYQDNIPELFKFNLLNVITNRWQFKYGSITSDLSHYFHLFKYDENIKNNENNFESNICLFFDKQKIINMICKYSFINTNDIKFIAAHHQIRATEKTIKRLKDLKNKDKLEKNKGGIIWHTQGSGKSLTMILICKQIFNNYPTSTIILITDRKQLEQQIHTRFKNAKKFLWTENIKTINSRKKLIDELKNKEHFGIYTTTIQKFIEETGTLSKRDDVFVLIDEAHRSQNTEDEFKVLKKTKTLLHKKGYAICLRKAFPNAKFIGFTGTPLISELSKDTRKEFGPYNDQYHMFEAVNDGVTVPIHYEIVKIHLILDKKYLDEMNEIQKKYIETLAPNSKISDIKQKKLLDDAIRKTLVFEDDDVIQSKVRHILSHWDERKKILNGKSMIVAHSRNAALKYYKKIIELRPELKEKVILVITKSNKDTKEMLDARVNDEDLNKVDKDFKNTQKYKFVIVVNKWLTGFDCQDLDTLYLDRIIKKHNLMQAIARVNRTYETDNLKKTNGLIVDYVGITELLHKALQTYAIGGLDGDKIEFELEDVQRSKEKLQECLELINNWYVKGLLEKVDFSKNYCLYNFVITKNEELSELNDLEKNKFLNLCRKLEYLYKAAFTKLTKKQKTLTKIIVVIKKLLTANELKTDKKLQFSIEKMKEALFNTVKTNKPNVNIYDSNLDKSNLNKISLLLWKEGKHLFDKKPRTAIKFLLESLELDIEEISTKRPVYYQKASEKLKDIIFQMDKEKDIEKIKNMIVELSKEVKRKNDEKLPVDNPELIPFYEIVASDKFIQKNSEVIREIAKDLLKEVKGFKSCEFESSLQVRSKLSYKLKWVLKNKYNYPPENMKNVSGLIVDRINNELKIKRKNFD